MSEDRTEREEMEIPADTPLWMIERELDQRDNRQTEEDRNV